MHATYRDLADLANGRALPTRDEWASRMLDRVALLLYRQPRLAGAIASQAIDIASRRSIGSSSNAPIRRGIDAPI
jgi:hypothetical protein